MTGPGVVMRSVCGAKQISWLSGRDADGKPFSLAFCFTCVFVISPSGKITRYLYGVQQLPLDVKMALLEASEGRTGPTIAKVLTFCYSYDPEGKHYTFNVVHISGLVIVGLVVLFAGVFLVKPKKKNRGDLS